MKKRQSPSEAVLVKKLQVVKQQDLEAQSWLPFGHIAGAHGIRGALKVKSDNPNSDFLQKGIRLGFVMPKGDLAIMTVESVFGGGRVHFEELIDRNDAEVWLSSKLMIQRDDMPELVDNEVYLVDLLGAKAIDTNGELLGEIIGFSDNRAQHLVQIKTATSPEALLPFIRPILQEIRESEHTVVFDPPKGWDDV